MLNKSKALKQIATEIASCKVCRHLCEKATNPVPGEGSPHAEIMFIGEAPGRNEDLQGRPFVGEAGRFLEEMLKGIGYRREDVYITNVVKYRPPENRDPTTEEINQCLPLLLRQIEVIKPKLIVLLGRHALSVFLPEFKISSCHGQPKRKNGQVYLPLYHPAAALYNQDMRQVLERDFKKIPKVLSII